MDKIGYITHLKGGVADTCLPHKIMKKRIFCLALTLMMLLSLLPALGSPVKAATESQNNIVARADYFYGITWTAKSTVYGWNWNYEFTAGSTYRIPYGQPINSGAYIGYYVSIEDFLSAANTAGSVFYTSRSTYDSTSSVYYATDCSAFVSWCWGVDRKTTYSIPQISTNLGYCTTSNSYNLQLGDALNSNDVGHVVLVTGLTYNSSGTLTQIEITEQTPPMMKRSYYTPSELGSKYGGYYTIQRYSGSVPASPGGNSGGSTDTTGKYYPACSSSATTFYGGMSEIGISCDWDLHCDIAAANGITDFSGTAEQNTTLLNLLKAGKLINPNYSGSDDSGSDDSGGTVTDGSNGYERGYAGGMAGTGEYKAFGLDVSSWQGSSLNFTRIKNAGYDYVILRAGTTNGKDECFETYYTNAKAAGLDVGVYYYSYATSVAAVKEDMNDFISYIAGKKYEYPVYFDYEDASQQALSSSLSQQICLTAMDMLAAEGYLVGMYTGKYFSTQLPMSTICAKYEVWIAHYLAVGDGSYDGTYDYTTYGPSYSTQYGMYQFTDSVWINGYGPYDGDVCYKDYPSIVKTYGFNGYTAEVSGTGNSYIDQYCTFYPSHCTLEVTEAVSLRSEPRSASDELDTVSVGDILTATGMYSNNGNNMWYRVSTSSGETAYIYSGRVKYLNNVTSDITISNYSTPTTITEGDYFLVTGTIASKYNTLNKVGAHVYSGSSTTTGTPATGGSASASNNKYVLDGSAVDDAVAFGDLAPGNYNYVISAEYSSYYASSTKEATKTTETVNLVAKSFKVADSSGNVPAESYFDKCTFYPSRCTFTTNRDTGVFSEPRTQKTGNTSVKLEDAPNGTTYTSTGLYVNSGSNIFYQVKTADGQNGYIYSGYTDFGKKAYDDIKLSGADLPNGHVEGDVFLVTGTISSTYNVLGTATVSIYSGFGVSGTPVTGGSATVTNNKYVLDGSAIDDATAFNDLSTGNYTYRITVTFTSYYAKEPQVLGTLTGTRTLKKHYFTVVDSTVDQDTCSHNNKTTVIEAATCTATGISVTACSICGLTQKVTTDKLSHSYGSYTTTLQPTCTEPGSKEKTCSVCGKVYTKEIAATGHSYSSATCTESSTCTVCGVSSGEPAGHSYNAVVTAPTCTKDGYTTYTCSACGDSYTGNTVAATGHSWKAATCNDPKTCTICGTTSGNALGHSYSAVVTAPTCTTAGYTTYTCTTCGDSYTGNNVSALGHSWSDATCTEDSRCTTCGASGTAASGHKYTSVVTAPECLKDGYTTHTCSICGHSYKDSFITANGHNWKSATCTDPMICTVCGTTNGSALGHSYKSEITKPGCQIQGYTSHTCTTCGHSYVDSYVDPSGHSWKEATCTAPMTCTACGITTGSALGHSYVKGICSVCGAKDPDYVEVLVPTISLKIPTLLLEDTIKLNIYYTIDQDIALEKMGMITWKAQPSVVDISTADAVYPGATFNSGNGYYGVNMDGIPAQNLGDTIYFCIYAELADGSIVYSKQVQYSPATYAYNQLNGSSATAKAKALFVAILNYGAAAQTYLEDTDPLVNANLTDEAKALVEAYRSDMVHSVAMPNATKQGAMAANGGFSAKKPSISLDGAFSINYYFTPSAEVAGDMTFYYWNAADFAAVDVLSVDNATGSAAMTNNNGEYSAAISGIAAKDIDGALYACGVYTDANGNTYSTGILPYSLGFFCGNQVNTGTEEIQPLAAAIAVYGYHAAIYFAQ